MREINYNGKTYTQVQKRTAEKIFNNGGTVYIIACNANPNSPWINGFYELSIELLPRHDDYLPEYDNDFRKHVNYHKYYNCNSELGKYPHFYILK